MMATASYAFPSQSKISLHLIKISQFLILRFWFNGYNYTNPWSWKSKYERFNNPITLVFKSPFILLNIKTPFYSVIDFRNVFCFSPVIYSRCKWIVLIRHHSRYSFFFFYHFYLFKMYISFFFFCLLWTKKNPIIISER